MNLRFLSLLLLLPASLCMAQERQVRPELWRLGGYAGGQIIGYTVDIAGLPGIPTCCPEFTDGSGQGMAIGASYELRLPQVDPRFSVGTKLLFSLYGTTLEAEERKLVTADRDTATAIFGHTIETSQPALGAEFYGGFEVMPRLTLLGGGRVDMMLGGSYHQQEEIISPETIRYENDQRTRLVFDGSIPEENPLHLSAVIGARYDIPINLDHTLYLSPEVIFWQGFSNIINGNEWTMRGVRFGLSCSFIHRETPAPTPVTPDPTPKTPEVPSTPGSIPSTPGAGSGTHSAP